MDTFMDKLAQKLNAQEMIKANSAADAEEMDQLKSQLREYDECLAQMQQVNKDCLLYTSPSPRDRQKSRMPSSA